MTHEKKNYALTAETGRFSLEGGNSFAKVKRGELSWAYFPIAYSLLLTFFIGIISVVDIWYVYRIGLMIVSAAILFRLCFFNAWFRNKIVGVFSKSKDFEEISRH